jgi:hypothetical protein
MNRPAWVNNPDDPREKLRLLIAQEFQAEHGTTILYDFGATVVDTIVCHQDECKDAWAAAVLDLMKRMQA